MTDDIGILPYTLLYIRYNKPQRSTVETLGLSIFNPALPSSIDSTWIPYSPLLIMSFRHGKDLGEAYSPQILLVGEGNEDQQPLRLCDHRLRLTPTRTRSAAHH